MKKSYKNQIFIALFDIFPIKLEGKGPLSISLNLKSLCVECYIIYDNLVAIALGLFV